MSEAIDRRAFLGGLAGLVTGLAGCMTAAGRKSAEAERFLDEGQYADALRLYSEALDIEPNNATLYFNRGVVHAKSGSWAMAERDLNRALQIDPSFDDAYCFRGYVNFHWAEAKRAFRKEDEAQDRYEYALADLTRATRGNPEKPQAYAYLGFAYDATHDGEKACDALEKAVRLLDTRTKKFKAIETPPAPLWERNTRLRYEELVPVYRKKQKA